MAEALKVQGEKGQQVCAFVHILYISVRWFLVLRLFPTYGQDRDTMTGKLIGIQGLFLLHTSLNSRAS